MKHLMGGNRPLLREKFFDFSQEERTKNEFILPPMDLKKWFFPSTTAPPFEKKRPPLPKS
jgi:hypothetical protein